MKRRKVDSVLEKQFLIGMITNKQFLSSLDAMLDVSLFEADYVQRIAKWCLKYFKRHGTPPGKSIESIYHSWVENEKPREDDSAAISDFLETLSGEYDITPPNVPHLLDEAGNYLTLRKVARLKDQIENALSIGEKENAIEAIQAFRSVNLGDEIGYQPLRSRSVVKDTYAEPFASLIQFGGDAGKFLDPAFTRDSLIGIQAHEKKGKTYWELEIVYRALRSGRRVAMFQCGDLSRRQLNKRWDMRMSRLPLWESQMRGVMVPQSIKLVEDDGKWEPKIKHNLESFSRTINAKDVLAAQKVFRRRHKLKGDELMFSVHPTSTINVAGINAILERWSYELDFVPDVILVDYADILAPEKELRDERMMVNQTWQALRRLSQEWRACVVVATQANKESYSVRIQTKKNVANDKRKNAEVTAMLGLNQTADEKVLGIMRVNWIESREFQSNENECLYVAQCIPLGQAMVKATLKRDNEY